MHQAAKQGPFRPLTFPDVSKPIPRHFAAFTLAAIGLVLIAGSWQFRRLSTLVTRHEQDTLLSHAVSVARSLSHTHFDTLSFTADDVQQPAYHHLHQKLATASQHLGLRGLFTIAERGGIYVFDRRVIRPIILTPHRPVPATASRPQKCRSRSPNDCLVCLRSSPMNSVISITAFVPMLDPYREKSPLLAADMNLPVLRRRLMKVSGLPCAHALHHHPALFALGY